MKENEIKSTFAIHNNPYALELPRDDLAIFLFKFIPISPYR